MPFLLLGRPLPVHVQCMPIIHPCTGTWQGASAYSNPSIIIFRSRCDWWQGWGLGLREGSADQTRSCRASGGTNNSASPGDYAGMTAIGIVPWMGCEVQKVRTQLDEEVGRTGLLLRIRAKRFWSVDCSSLNTEFRVGK